MAQVYSLKNSFDVTRFVSLDDVLGCKRLLFAILERALLDIASDKTGKCLVAQHAKCWINCKGKDSVTSYEYICKIFDIEPSILRDEKTLERVCKYLKQSYAQNQRKVGNEKEMFNLQSKQAS